MGVDHATKDCPVRWVVRGSRAQYDIEQTGPRIGARVDGGLEAGRDDQQAEEQGTIHRGDRELAVLVRLGAFSAVRVTGRTQGARPNARPGREDEHVRIRDRSSVARPDPTLQVERRLIAAKVAANGARQHAENQKDNGDRLGAERGRLAVYLPVRREAGLMDRAFPSLVHGWRHGVMGELFFLEGLGEVPGVAREMQPAMPSEGSSTVARRDGNRSSFPGVDSSLRADPWARGRSRPPGCGRATAGAA